MNINEIINLVVSKVDRGWPVLNQVRFAYLELGKYLQKDTDFFFSVDNKLQNYNLTFEEIESIYSDDGELRTQVICRSASKLFKMVLDRLGIESKLVKSINNVMNFSDGSNDIDINHWFLAVRDSDGECFFCTLSSDLPYIQMGMETKHFGVNIPYKKELSDGTFEQVYDGEEIRNKVIDKRELKRVDIDIGYVKSYYHYDDMANLSKDWHLQYDNSSLFLLRDAVRNDKLFIELELGKTDFIKNAYEFVGADGRNISFYEDAVNGLTQEDWQVWIKIICNAVLDKISEIVGYQVIPIPPIESEGWNYEAWLFSLSVILEDQIYSMLDLKSNATMDDSLYIDVTSFNYGKWSKKVKNTFVFDKNYEYENIILLLDKLNVLVNYVRGSNKHGHLNAIFHSLGIHFLDKDNLYINNIEEDGKLSNDYIANKLEVMFQHVFSCNDIRTGFNDMSYSEQVVIIKEVLGILFPEVTYKNSHMISNYDNRFSPIMNRIQLFPVRNNESGNYAIVFGILAEEKGDEEIENEYYFFYDLKSNKFEVCDLLRVYRNYTLVSTRMMNRLSIEDLENIGGKRKK